MATLETDPITNDLVLKNNSLSVIAGADEVAQRIRARLRMFRGEWFLNLKKGMPFYEIIFAKGSTDETIASAIKREILTVPGVLELLRYSQSIDSKTRQLVVDFQVKVTDGAILDLQEVF